MLFPEKYRIIDISQPVSSKTACFPGDVPFQKTITVSYENSQVMNLTSFTMSPHVGSHADAPVHIQGNLAEDPGTIGNMALSPFIGTAYVLDIAPIAQEIQLSHIQQKLSQLPSCPKRLLFRTTQHIRYNVFEAQYAYFSASLIEYLAAQGVVLVGIDTPSVDHINSKTLEAHHALLKGNISWLENLDLTQVSEGSYFLMALPLKFMELEASPVRAVLLSATK